LLPADELELFYFNNLPILKMYKNEVKIDSREPAVQSGKQADHGTPTLERK